MQRILQQPFVPNSPYENVLNRTDEVLSIIKPHLPPSLVNAFARPMLRERNGEKIIEWFTDLEGQPQLLTSSSENQTALSQAKTTLSQHLDKIEALRQDLSSKQQISEEKTALLQQFIQAAQSRSRQFYLINGQIVLTSWGLDASKPVAPPIAPVAAASPHWCRWLWIPLLLALLLALAWWFFFRAQPVVEVPVEPVKVAEPAPEPPKVEEPIVQPEPAPEPTPVVEEPAPEPVKTCRVIEKPTDAPQVVIIFNNASSMNYTLLESAKKIRQFDERLGSSRVSKKDIDYMRRKPNRATAAKEVLPKLIDQIPNAVDIGLVELKSCLSRSPKQSAATSYGFFSANERNKLKKMIKQMKVRQNKVSGTSIYEGLLKAIQLVDGIEREALIVLITEGNGDCTNRDINMLIDQTVQVRPKLKINIVSINSPVHYTDYLAEATGGEIIDYDMTSIEKLTEGINQAMKPVQEEICQ